MSSKPKVRKPRAKKEPAGHMVSEGIASVVALFPHALIHESGTKVVVINTVGGN